MTFCHTWCAFYFICIVILFIQRCTVLCRATSFTITLVSRILTRISIRFDCTASRFYNLTLAIKLYNQQDTVRTSVQPFTNAVHPQPSALRLPTYQESRDPHEWLYVSQGWYCAEHLHPYQRCNQSSRLSMHREDP